MNKHKICRLKTLRNHLEAASEYLVDIDDLFDSHYQLGYKELITADSDFGEARRWVDKTLSQVKIELYKETGK